MNPFEFVIAVLILVFAFTIIRHKMGIPARSMREMRGDPRVNDVENDRLKHQVQQLQELGNGRDFIALAVHGDLAQRHLGLGGPGTDHVQGAQLRTGRAAQGLAIDGDVLDAGQTGDVAQPRQAAGLQGARMEGGEDSFKRIVRRDAAG